MNDIVLKHANLLDGSLNMKLQKDVDILIHNGKIKAIKKDIAGVGVQVIDCTNRYIAPGLINLHAHLPASGKVGKKRSADKAQLVQFIKKTALTRSVGVMIGYNTAKTALLSGTTTVRAVGGVGNFDTMLRDAIKKEWVIGPRLVVANEAICPVGGHMAGTVSEIANTIEDAVKMVEVRKKQGVDFIKIMITGGVLDCKTIGHPGDLKMQKEMVKAICDKAHELGLKVAAHVEGEEGMIVAIENGVDTIEHASNVPLPLLKKFIARGGVVVTTISPALPLMKIDPKETGYDDAAKINSTVLFNSMVATSRAMLENGGVVGLGTDTGCPYITHYDMWRELVYFKHYVSGVDNSFAIHTATQVNASILGLDKVTGSLEPGKDADLVVLEANPLEDLSAYRQPVMVFARGKKFTQKVKKYENIEKNLDAMKL